MTTPEIVLSLLIVAVGFPAIYWGLKERDRRHKIPSPMPDGDYYFMAKYIDERKKYITDAIAKSQERLQAYRELYEASEMLFKNKTPDNLIDLYQAKEKVKSML